jgi:hypothetical protein
VSEIDRRKRKRERGRGREVKRVFSVLVHRLSPLSLLLLSYSGTEAATDVHNRSYDVK